MEQIFTVLRDRGMKGASWGPICGLYRIPQLQQVPLSQLQSIWDALYVKYESLQAQILTVSKLDEYDWIYSGVLPGKVVRHQTGEMSIHERLTREMNHTYLILDDFSLTHEKVQSGDYSLASIPPLYRICVSGEHMITNFHHAVADARSMYAMMQDFMLLLNARAMDTTPLAFTSIEQCVADEYASWPLLNRLTEYVPSWLMFRFMKRYANNAWCAKYNPLSAAIHHDDILR